MMHALDLSAGCLKLLSQRAMSIQHLVDRIKTLRNVCSILAVGWPRCEQVALFLRLRHKPRTK